MPIRLPGDASKLCWLSDKEVDTDQTSIVWSVSTLFAKTCLSTNLDQIWCFILGASCCPTGNSEG